MSEEKVKDDLQEDSEVTADIEGGSQTTEEAGEPAVQAEEMSRGLEQELADAQQEAADLRDRILRMAAENENFKKRMERERLASMKYAGEAIFRELLPVVDNLERAVEQGVIDGADAEKNLAALLEGVELTLKSLLATLQKFEVKSVESVGKPFDPQHQEAMTMAESDTVPANHVLSEFQKGYYFKDRLLRAAKVVVSAGKATGDSKG